MAYSLRLVKTPAKTQDFQGFNIYWMGRIREAMEAVGMAHDDGDPGLDEVVEHEMELDGYPHQTYYGGRHYAVRPTIPLFKLSSNDPWWITVPEIRAALNAYDYFPWSTAELPETVMDTLYSDVWHKWIAFLRNAERHDGFTVR